MDSGFFAIAGAVVGGLLGFGGTWFNNRLSFHRMAASDLRAAFAPEVAFMRLTNIEGDAIKIKLEAAFDKHALAVEKFRYFVRTKDRDTYDQAWRSYYEQGPGGSVRFYEYYMGAEQQKGKDSFHKHINLILVFAKT